MINVQNNKDKFDIVITFIYLQDNNNPALKEIQKGYERAIKGLKDEKEELEKKLEKCSKK